MKLWLVSNGLQNADASMFNVYVYAADEESAIRVARRIFAWQKDRFGFMPSFDAELFAFCMDASAVAL